MKKLPCLLLLSLALSLAKAQNAGPNSFGMTLGPNWRMTRTNVSFSGKIRARTGYQFGIQYSRELFPHWEILLGLQHLEWHSVYTPGNSIVNPLPPWQTSDVEIRENAWQFHYGIRWSGAPKTWKGQVEFLSGIVRTGEPQGEKQGLRFMVHLGAGLEWTNGRIGLFALPGLQYIFKESNRDKSNPYTFWVPLANTGVRRWF